MIELTQVKTGELLDLLQAVNQRVSVNKQLSGRLGYVQVILEEALDGEQRFVVKALDAAALEYLMQEGLAEGGRQVIDESCDAEIVVADDDLVCIEYLADLQRGLCFLEGTRQILDAGDRCTDADIHAGIELTGQGIRNGACQLFEVLGIHAGLDLLDQNNIALGDVEHEVLVLVREQVLDDIVSGDVICGNDADEENDAADLCIEVQLACLDDDITGEHVIQHNVLDEVVAVVLLVIILLDVGECDGKDARIFGGCFIRALYEYRIIGLLVSTERLIGVTVADEDVMCIAEIQRYKFVCGADLGEVAAGDDCCVLVHDADGSVHGIAHLVYQSLEQSVGHKLTSLLFDVKYRT